MELICFDLDNTLINSEKASIKSYNSALVKNGFQKVSSKNILALSGMPHYEIVEKLTKIKNRKLIDKVCLDHDKAIINTFSKEVRIISGVKSTIKKLSQRYDLAIVSNASHNSVLAKMKWAGLDKKYFKIIIGNDDVKRSKPYPDEILKAEKLEHHRAVCIVGDSIYDMMAGKQAGVKTIGVLSGRYSRERLKRYKPDFIIDKISDLCRIL